tara:strand:- start:585 stop:785 length:201 start_codon:yes stop_codon:yes gene_type:complete
VEGKIDPKREGIPSPSCTPKKSDPQAWECSHEAEGRGVGESPREREREIERECERKRGMGKVREIK